MVFVLEVAKLDLASSGSVESTTTSCLFTLVYMAELTRLIAVVYMRKNMNLRAYIRRHSARKWSENTAKTWHPYGVNCWRNASGRNSRVTAVGFVGTSFVVVPQNTICSSIITLDILVLVDCWDNEFSLQHFMEMRPCTSYEEDCMCIIVTYRESPYKSSITSFTYKSITKLHTS